MTAIKRLPIKHLLPMLIVAPSILVMGVLTMVFWQKTKQNIQIVSIELGNTIADHISQKVQHYLQTPHGIIKLNLEKIKSGNLNVEDLSSLEQYFWKKIKIFQAVSHIYYGNSQGEFRGAELLKTGEIGINVSGKSTQSNLTVYQSTVEGRKGKILGKTPNYDPRIRPWYQAALQSEKPVWSEIYRDFDTSQLGITAAQVVRDQNRKVLGVFAVDFLFDQINQFLENLTIAKTGQVLIIDRKGQLIASSNSQLITESNREAASLFVITNSTDDLMEAIATTLLQEFGDFSQADNYQDSFKFQGKRQYLQVKPFRDRLGLDWLIIVVIPEADFMQQVQLQTWIVFGLHLGILLLAIGVGLGVSRWILQPIFRFEEAANQIKNQSFDIETLQELTQRQDEVGELARVFVEMAVETGDRQHSLEEQLSLLNFDLSPSQNNPYELGPLKRWQKKATCIRKIHGYHFQIPQLLSQVPYYQNLTPNQLEQLVINGKIKQIYVGDYICRENEPGDEFYIILTGSVRIFIEKLNKHLVDLSTGQCFGELAVMLGGNRTATAIALEETTLFCIDRYHFGRVLHQYPQMAEVIAQDLHRHQLELQERKQILADYDLLDQDSESDLLGRIKHRLTTLFHL